MHARYGSVLLHSGLLVFALSISLAVSSPRSVNAYGKVADERCETLAKTYDPKLPMTQINKDPHSKYFNKHGLLGMMCNDKNMVSGKCISEEVCLGTKCAGKDCEITEGKGIKPQGTPTAQDPTAKAGSGGTPSATQPGQTQQPQTQTPASGSSRNAPTLTTGTGGSQTGSPDAAGQLRGVQTPQDTTPTPSETTPASGQQPQGAPVVGQGNVGQAPTVSGESPQGTNGQQTQGTGPGQGTTGFGDTGEKPSTESCGVSCIVKSAYGKVGDEIAKLEDSLLGKPGSGSDTQPTKPDPTTASDLNPTKVPFGEKIGAYDTNRLLQKYGTGSLQGIATFYDTQGYGAYGNRVTDRLQSYDIASPFLGPNQMANMHVLDSEGNILATYEVRNHDTGNLISGVSNNPSAGAAVADVWGPELRREIQADTGVNFTRDGYLRIVLEPLTSNTSVSSSYPLGQTGGLAPELGAVTSANTVTLPNVQLPSGSFLYAGDVTSPASSVATDAPAPYASTLSPGGVQLDDSVAAIEEQQRIRAEAQAQAEQNAANQLATEVLKDQRQAQADAETAAYQQRLTAAERSIPVPTAAEVDLNPTASETRVPTTPVEKSDLPAPAAPQPTFMERVQGGLSDAWAGFKSSLNTFGTGGTVENIEGVPAPGANVNSANPDIVANPVTPVTNTAPVAGGTYTGEGAPEVKNPDAVNPNPDIVETPAAPKSPTDVTEVKAPLVTTEPEMTAGVGKPSTEPPTTSGQPGFVDGALRSAGGAIAGAADYVAKTVSGWFAGNDNVSGGIADVQAPGANVNAANPDIIETPVVQKPATDATVQQTTGDLPSAPSTPLKPIGTDGSPVAQTGGPLQLTPTGPATTFQPTTPAQQMQEVAVPDANEYGRRKYYELGDSDPEIAKVQRNLNELGYKVTQTGSETGDFGPKTLAAVKQFQSDNGLTADGKVGQNTIATMNDIVRESNAAQAAPAETAGTFSGDVLVPKTVVPTVESPAVAPAAASVEPNAPAPSVPAASAEPAPPASVPTPTFTERITGIVSDAVDSVSRTVSGWFAGNENTSDGIGDIQGPGANVNSANPDIVANPVTPVTNTAPVAGGTYTGEGAPEVKNPDAVNPNPDIVETPAAPKSPTDVTEVKAPLVTTEPEMTAGVGKPSTEPPTTSGQPGFVDGALRTAGGYISSVAGSISSTVAGWFTGESAIPAIEETPSIPTQNTTSADPALNPPVVETSVPNEPIAASLPAGIQNGMDAWSTTYPYPAGILNGMDAWSTVAPTSINFTLDQMMKLPPGLENGMDAWSTAAPTADQSALSPGLENGMDAWSTTPPETQAEVPKTPLSDEQKARLDELEAKTDRTPEEQKELDALKAQKDAAVEAEKKAAADKEAADKADEQKKIDDAQRKADEEAAAKAAKRQQAISGLKGNLATAERGINGLKTASKESPNTDLIKSGIRAFGNIKSAVDTIGDPALTKQLNAFQSDVNKLNQAFAVYNKCEGFSCISAGLGVQSQRDIVVNNGTALLSVVKAKSYK